MQRHNTNETKGRPHRTTTLPHATTNKTTLLQLSTKLPNRYNPIRRPQFTLLPSTKPTPIKHTTKWWTHPPRQPPTTTNSNNEHRPHRLHHRDLSTRPTPKQHPTLNNKQHSTPYRLPPQQLLRYPKGRRPHFPIYRPRKQQPRQTKYPSRPKQHNNHSPQRRPRTLRQRGHRNMQSSLYKSQDTKHKPLIRHPLYQSTRPLI